MKINNPEWYPCYLNPNFAEIFELAKSQAFTDTVINVVWN